MAKVLHIYKTYMPFTMGGVEQVIQQLAISTAAVGHTHQVLTLHEGCGVEVIQRPEAEVTGVPWHLHIQSTPLSIDYIKRFRVMASKVDIIHYHHPFPLQDIAQLFSKSDKPSVVTYHSDVIRQKWANKVYSPLLNHFLGAVNVVVASSEQYRQSSTVLQAHRDKTQVIPFGLAEDSYPGLSSSIENSNLQDVWREKFPEGFFLFVGVLRYYKGLNVLIEAAEKTGLPVVIAGDGPIRKTVEQAADEIKNVHYLGMVSETDKMALLRVATAFAFPSAQRSEAFGISLLEAAMFGKALISAEIGTGTSFINQHNETGIVIPANDASALADAMNTLWHDESLRQVMGEAARARFLEKFTASEMGQRYAKVYEQLLGSPENSASTAALE